jgi:indolepyruvate ferredoxin oxidoreductase alpha subunit
VVIATAPCVLEYRIKHEAYRVEAAECTGCKACLRAGCTALSLYVDDAGERKVEIDPTVCAGCGVCAQLCNFEAIKAPQPEGGEEAR